jgi:hypothetical protein
MKKNQKLLFFLLTTFFLLLSLFLIERDLYRYDKVTYFEFKTLLREGKVQDVVIKKKEIYGKFLESAADTLSQIRKTPVKVGAYFKTVYPDDPELFKLLEEKRHKLRGKA